MKIRFWLHFGGVLVAFYRRRDCWQTPPPPFFFKQRYNKSPVSFAATLFGQEGFFRRSPLKAPRLGLHTLAREVEAVWPAGESPVYGLGDSLTFDSRFMDKRRTENWPMIRAMVKSPEKSGAINVKHCKITR